MKFDTVFSWDVIAAFINEHRKVTEGQNTKNGKDVVIKVKEMQKLGNFLLVVQFLIHFFEFVANFFR